MSENKDLEIAFKKETIKATATKKKAGRPKGVKNGQGKKKATRKKASEKTAIRKSRLNPKERAGHRAKITEYFGASKVDKILVKAQNLGEQETLILQLKKQMESELEQEKRDVEEYYAQIDAEYKKVGRPKSVFNERELKYLCSIHCTLEEIAGFFQMNKQILSRKIKEEYGLSWTQFYERNCQGSKVSLRRRQIQAAMEGDTQMLKFLGINMLGQKNKLDFEGEVKVNSWVDLLKNLDPEAESKENEEA